MACPAREPHSKFDQTYGVNYIAVFSYYYPDPPPGGWNSADNGSARLSKIPARVFLAADARTLYGNGASAVPNPKCSGSWTLDYDYDKDGVKDTAIGELFGGVGPYNGLWPIHPNKQLNFLFADGSVKTMKIASWARNEGDMWGRGLPYSVYK